MKNIISVSIPRSGHHLLIQILSHYFKIGQFLYCERYTDSECCGRTPCNAVGRRAKNAFGTDIHLRLFLQKSHDREYEVSIEPSSRYVVQLRDPAQAVIGWLRWEMTRGWRDNFSLGDIPRNVFDFLCYYIRFSHKWCMPAMLGMNHPTAHVIHYETLIGPRERCRSALLRLLEWMNLPIDDTRLDHALDKSLHIDSHTGDVRTPEEHRHDITYYDRLCGGSLRFLLDQVVAFCPGLPQSTLLANQDGFAYEYSNQQMNALFFPLDLSITPDTHLNFTTSERVLHRNSLAVDRGYPSLCRALGFSYGDKGSGIWTFGDKVILPFRISSSAQTLFGEIAVLDSDRQLDWTQLLTLSAVLQGTVATVQTSYSANGGCTLLTFRMFAPQITAPTPRNCALVLAIAKPDGSIPGAPHGVNACLKSLSLSSVAAPGGPITANDEFAVSHPRHVA
jgi:hypothetical protein